MHRYLFLLIAIAFLLFRTVPTILSGRFTFAFDMGRDMLWVRNMVELKKPTLIGPWGSIAGVYFGPLWFYLLSMPYVLFNGDPRGAVVVPLLSNIATLVIGWWFLRREKHPIAANIWAVLYGFSPLVISISEFSFHANLLPLATLLFLIGLHNHFNLLNNWNPWWFGLSALMASVSYHLEPAAGVMLTLAIASTIVLSVMRHQLQSKTLLQSFKRLKSMIGIAGLLFVLPFTPQLIFELRHDFIQTKALVSYFRGENESLGGVLPLSERVPERVTKFARTLSQTVLPLEQDWQKWVLLGVIGILGIFVMKQKNIDRFTSYLILNTSYFILLHYFSYTFLFPPELKNWYLFGFASVFLMAIALIFDESIRYLRLKVSDTFRTSVVITFVVLVWFWKTVNPSELIKSVSSSPSAPETLRAQLEVVDYVYQDAKKTGLPFSVYTYTPPIYDYTYQYLLWWRGTRKYQILPAEFSYQPGETLYLPEKGKFISSTWKPEDTKFVYLIIEPDQIEERIKGWLGHFSKLQVLKYQSFPSGVAVQIRDPSIIQKIRATKEGEIGVSSIDPDKKTLLTLGDQALLAIKRKEMDKIIELMDQSKGVFFSYFYSGLGTTLYQTDLKNFFTDQTVYEWGTGASGIPIRLTMSEFYSGEIDSQKRYEPLYDKDYLSAPEVGVNKPVYISGNSATIEDVIGGFYPGRNIKFVEYFFPGTEEYAEHDFSVLSLVFEKVNSKFFLVGVFKDSWTP